MKNLSERIKIPELKQALTVEFSQFGRILDVVAHNSLKRRGQAFVVFDDLEGAKKAYEQYTESHHEMFGKPLIVEYSKSASDATILRKQGPQEYEKNKQQRTEFREQRMIEKQSELSKKRGVSNGSPAPGARAPKKARTTAAANEALPRNKILFLENLPPGITQDNLSEIFSRYPGFVEVRLVAVRRLGFVEYTSDEEAVAAKQGTSDLVQDGFQVKITYAKR